MPSCNRMRVSVFLPRTAIKPAKFAVRDADIRVIKMPVDVVISRPPVLPSPDRIRQFPQRIQIVGVIKCNAFIKGQTLTSSTFAAISFKFVSNENCINLVECHLR